MSHNDEFYWTKCPRCPQQWHIRIAWRPEALIDTATQERFKAISIGCCLKAEHARKHPPSSKLSSKTRWPGTSFADSSGKPWLQQGSFPVRKRTGTLRTWRARRGRCPQRGPGAEPLVRGSGGQSPPEAEGILLPKRVNLSLSFKWNLNFAAICRKGPERRSGDQKKNRNGVPVRSGSKRTLDCKEHEACTGG